MSTVAYGTGQISFQLGPGDSLTEREQSDGGTTWNTDRFLQSLSKAGFDRFLSGGRLLVVINDAFRSTPTGKILSQIAKVYPDFRGDFIVACGNHPAPSAADVSSILDGYRRPDESRVFFHNSRDFGSMAAVGTLDGYALHLNRLLFEYGAVLIIGSVEPHYFAGYTGGRKSLIPGLADVDSTRRNHALAVSREAQPLRLEGNPVAEHLERMLALVKLPNLFSIQIVTGRNHQVLDCFCGDLQRSFAEAAAFSRQVYSFAAPQLFDIVIAEMRPPLDRNLYQMQKGIENTAAAVRDDGVMVVISACSEGVGNDEFLQLARRLQRPEAVLAQAGTDQPPLGIHKLSRMVELSQRIRVKALTGLAPEIVRQVFIEPTASINDELDGLRSGGRNHLDILLVRDAGMLVVQVERT